MTETRTAIRRAERSEECKDNIEGRVRNAHDKYLGVYNVIKQHRA